MCDSYIAISTRRPSHDAVRGLILRLHHTLIMQAANALTRLPVCGGSSESFDAIICDQTTAFVKSLILRHWIINVAFLFILWHVTINRRKYTHKILWVLGVLIVVHLIFL